MLESKGVRAERLSDLYMLCRALGATLGDLVDTPGPVELRGGPTVSNPQEIVTTLLTASPAPPENVDLTPHVGRDDPAEESRLVAKWDISSRDLRSAVRHLAGKKALPVLFRDHLAGIYPTTPRRAAQAMRGHGTRQLGMLLFQYPDGVKHFPAGEYETTYNTWLDEVRRDGDR